MPSGYTYEIGKGISFKDFCLNCAKVFGACIAMRDDSVNKLIPVFKYSDYHPKKIKEYKKKLKKINQMKIEKAEIKSLKNYKKKLSRKKQYRDEKIKLKLQYEDMLNHVSDWIPPTSEHFGLKTFMKEQINKSVEFDCGMDYIINEIQAMKPLTGEQWLQEQKGLLLEDMTYHEKGWVKEKKDIDNRNKWVKELKESLK